VHTHKIDTHYLWHEIQHGIFHVDAGILYTLKELFTRPGATIREFLEGKRVKHFKPVALVFLLGTLYGILFHYFHIDPYFDDTKNDLLTKINTWLNSHYALVTLLTIPLSSFASFTFFKKSGYNYIEHGIVNLFLSSQKIILAFVLLPLMYIYSGTKEILNIIILNIILDLILTLWVYNSFFITYKSFNRIIRAIFSYIFSYILMIIVAVIIGVSLALIFGTK
jgi:hypothetical protein